MTRAERLTAVMAAAKQFTAPFSRESLPDGFQAVFVILGPSPDYPVVVGTLPMIPTDMAAAALSLGAATLLALETGDARVAAAERQSLDGRKEPSS